MKTLAYRFTALLFAALLAASLMAQTPVRVVSIVSLAAGSNAIGKLAANSGVDIGDVDVLTLPNVTVGIFPDNEPFNLAQVNGSTVQVATNSMNTTGAGLQAHANSAQCDATTPTSLTENQFGNLRMDCATHDLGVVLPAETTKVLGTMRQVGNVGGVLDAAIGAAPPANAQIAAGLGSGATGGFLIAPPVCDSQAVVNIVTATTTLIVTGVSGRHVRICSVFLLNSAADNYAFLSGTGATCGTGTAGMAGGTTAATGLIMAANSGFAHGSGVGTVLRTVATGDSVCIITSAATQLSGTLQYAIY